MLTDITAQIRAVEAALARGAGGPDEPALRAALATLHEVQRATPMLSTKDEDVWECWCCGADMNPAIGDFMLNGAERLLRAAEGLTP